MAIQSSAPSKTYVIGNNKRNIYLQLDLKPVYEINVRYGRERCPLQFIRDDVRMFIRYAEKHPTEMFYVTRVGVGGGCHTDDDIAPMFAFAPNNCRLPECWQAILPSQEGRQFWRV